MLPSLFLELLLLLSLRWAKIKPWTYSDFLLQDEKMTASYQLMLAYYPAQEKWNSIVFCITTWGSSHCLTSEKGHMTVTSHHWEDPSDFERGASPGNLGSGGLQTWRPCKDVNLCLFWRNILKVLAAYVRTFLLFWNLLEPKQTLLEFASEKALSHGF
jgi:hypothetical protein